MSTGTELAGTASEMFGSPRRLREGFERRLLGLLGQDTPGAFILVLANAAFEPAMFERLRGALADAFETWCGRFERGDRAATGAAADDAAVFEQIRQLGLDRLELPRWRRLGPWELQFNPLRALRPARMSAATVRTLRRPFDPTAFHFDRPFLRQEILWEGELAAAPVRLLFNKFPFAELHALLVPEPAAQRPQYLEQSDHRLIWDIAALLGRRLPDVGFGYNAQGAYASVNHLHVQMYMRAAGTYPIEAGEWRHNGGQRPYPLPVQRHDDSATAWSAIQMLHLAGITYNLLYRPGRVYVMPRAMQGSYRHSRWTSGFAWSELAGSITISDAAEFDRLSESDLSEEFARLAVQP
jgi:hypothetical protein